MTNKHLEFLDYILPILSEVYSETRNLESLYNQFTDYDDSVNVSYEVDYFKNLYNYEYFEVIQETNHVKILPEVKEYIDHYGSLSEYLKREELTRTKEIKRNNWINNRANIIALSMLIVVIITGSYSILSKERVKELSNQKTDLIELISHKDSLLKNSENIIKSKNAIIFELNEIINKSDTLK